MEKGGSSYYGVDSFHINVGVGDGAIHLLVKIYVDGTGKQVQKEIVSAVLADFGYWDGYKEAGVKSEHKNVHKLPNTIEFIKRRYDVKELRFDTLVFTHWDADHFGGIVTLLENDLNKRIRGMESLPSLTEIQKMADTFQFSFLKYKTGPKGEVRCSTILVAPISGYADFVAVHGIETAELNNDYTTHDFAVAISTNRFPSSKRGLNLSIKIAEESLPLLYCHKRILGWNLFSPPPGFAELSGWGSITSPSKLLEVNPPPVKGQPGLYIVGAGFLYLGQDKSNYVSKERATVTNSSSIAMMVIWDNRWNTGPGQTAKPTISHYFAGDTPSYLEQFMADWAASPITSMKLSHHGSKSSTSLEVLAVFDPKNYIITSGNNSGYGHPRWEIIMQLTSYIARRERDRNLAPGTLGKTLFCTQYPYYFLKNAADAYDIVKPGSINDISEGFRDFMKKDLSQVEQRTHSDIENYRQVLKKLVEDGATLHSDYELYVAARDGAQGFGTNTTRGINWILSLCEQRWNARSWVGDATSYNQATAQAGGDPWDSKDPKILSTAVDFIYVESRNSVWNPNDGRIGIRYRDSIDVTFSGSWGALPSVVAVPNGIDMGPKPESGMAVEDKKKLIILGPKRFQGP